MKRYIDYEGKKKIISFIFMTMFMITCLRFQYVYADGEYGSVMSTYSSEVKPQININYLGTTPESPMAGQDFTVRYEIDPLPFYNNKSGDKEIVLVLDVSGSMKNDNKLTNLKIAATQFVDALTVTTDNKVTPKITNLKIGIVSFSNFGAVNSDLIEVTSDNAVNDVNKDKLKTIINDLSASGGTNIGDGLRKGTYLLDKGNPVANKTLIFMADGEPTYYSCYSWLNREYYTELDDSNPSRGGNGSSDRDGKSLEYATTIGNIIKRNGYNVFSIGYGLGESTSTANKKMQKIHESMGGISSGDKSTFFATDVGSIDAVFEKIADTLKKSYTISDANLVLDLQDSITVVDGFEILDGRVGTIKIDPIIYNKNENNQYTSEKQVIEIVVRADKEGETNIFKDTSKITYIDIEGNRQEITIGSNSTVNIRPFSIEDAEKLDVDFKSIQDGYLIGDTITGKVTFTYYGVNDIEYRNAKFMLDDSIPENFTLINGSSNTLTFGNITSTVNKDYNIVIEDDSEVGIHDEKEYVLKGNYFYNLVKGNITEEQQGIAESKVKVKRGVIKAKVIDEAGNDITSDSKLSIESKSSNKVNGTVDHGYITFNNVKSGDYILAIEELPEGCEPQEDGNSTIIRVDYNNNVAEIVFRVNGVREDQNSEILSHGIYMQNTANDASKMLMESGEDGWISVASGMQLSIGVIVDVKDKNTKVELSSSQWTNDFGNIKLYKIENASMKSVEGKIINKNIVDFNGMDNGKYLIIYRFKPSYGDIRLNAKFVDSESSKGLQLRTEGSALPNLF